MAEYPLPGKKNGYPGSRSSKWHYPAGRVGSGLHNLAGTRFWRVPTGSYLYSRPKQEELVSHIFSVHSYLFVCIICVCACVNCFFLVGLRLSAMMNTERCNDVDKDCGVGFDLNLNASRLNLALSFAQSFN